MSTTFRTGTVALAISLALGTAAPSYAEENAEEAKDVERIAVVGTRSAPRSVAESPVPVDIVGGDELGKNASTDMLDQLQAAVPSFTVKQQPISDAASFIRPVNLRGLSSDSTLILLNGKRRHRASVIAFQGGGVNDGAQGPDISVIPSVALKQVEVLRDGAAAQYGSDAIAGVMNFVLKDDADGGSISARYGEYYEGDGRNMVIDGNVGLPFTDDGFVNLSFQLKEADPTSRSVQRPDAAALIQNGNTSVNNPAQIWGNPEVKDDVTLFANVGLDLGNDREFYMFGNYSERTATGGYYYRNPQNRGGVFTGDNGILVGDLDGVGQGIECPVLPISDNVLNTDAYREIASDSEVGQNCWVFNELFPGGYTPQFTGAINDTSLTMGTRGEIKGGYWDEWYYDLSGSVGRNESRYTLANTVNPSLGPNQPIDNTFDTGAYIQLEKSFNADMSKGVDVGFDEPVNFAFGAEWREESFEIISGEQASWEQGPLADQGFSVGSHGFAGFSPESQGENVRRSFAAYLDMEAQLTEKLLAGAAVRYEDFTSFGATTNYKLSMQYQLSDGVSLRLSHSTGFRAPTVGQANVVNTQTSLVGGELVQSATYPPTHPVSLQKGGVELQPEESESWAGGIVYQDGDFFLTVDAYSIEVTDRIAQTDKIDIVESDWAPLREAGIQNPELLGTITYFANDFDTTTNGLDIVANYSAEHFGGSTKYSVAYNYNRTNVDDFSDATGEFKVRRLEEAIPKHRATFTLAQDWEDVSAFIRANYFGEYLAVHADSSDPGWFETADSAVTIDAQMSYFLNESVTLSVGANNIFDQEAHELPRGDIGAYSIVGAKYYESGPFDYNGGFYYVKATYKF